MAANAGDDLQRGIDFFVPFVPFDGATVKASAESSLFLFFFFSPLVPLEWPFAFTESPHFPFAFLGSRGWFRLGKY